MDRPWGWIVSPFLACFACFHGFTLSWGSDIAPRHGFEPQFLEPESSVLPLRRTGKIFSCGIASLMGFEPTTSTVTGWRALRCSTGPKGLKAFPLPILEMITAHRFDTRREASLPTSSLSNTRHALQRVNGGRYLRNHHF